MRVADYDHCIEPGDFYFSPPNKAEGGTRRLSFRCPCGCGDLCGVKVNDDGSTANGAWSWNKDEEKPTVRPSIAIQNCRPNSGDHWHGFLTDGVFQKC